MGSSQSTKAKRETEIAENMGKNELDSTQASKGVKDDVLHALEKYLEFAEAKVHGKSDLEDWATENVLLCQYAICNLKRTEEDLIKERQLRKSLEMELKELKSVRKRYEGQVKRLEELQCELKDTKIKHDNEIKSKQRLESQLKLKERESHKKMIEIVVHNIEKEFLKTQLENQTRSMQELEGLFEDTKLKLADEIKYREELGTVFKTEYYESKKKTARIFCHVEEKESLKQQLESQTKIMTELQHHLDDTKFQLEAEINIRQQLETKFASEEYGSKEKALQVLHDSVETKSRTLQQLQEDLKKTHAEIDIAQKTTGELAKAETEKKITENSMEEHDNFRQLEKKYVVLEYQKLATETKLEEQLKQLNEVKNNLLKEIGLRKTTQGKLAFMETNFTLLKQFCERELGERRNFLEKIKTFGGCYGKTQASNEGHSKVRFDDLLKEQMCLETELEGKINEIAWLKQDLKQRKDEMQRLACSKHVENKNVR